MPVFRCPYCGGALRDSGTGSCPSCGRVCRGADFYSRRRARPREPAPRSPRRRVAAGRTAAIDRFARLLSARNPATVILIVALLVAGAAALMGRAFRVRPDPALELAHWEEVAELNLAELMLALGSVRAHCGRLPDTEEGLASLVHNPGMPGWRGPYVLELKPDPWKRPFRYACTGDVARLASDGPDGIPDTGDDLLAPPLEPVWTGLHGYPVRIEP